jgi:rfaE bifunctional protein kinase chain/domain/rfaE bifunctional protein nucleotidyltransferase chain/domain
MSAKVFELDDLAHALERERAAGRTIVLCHGVFDLLHVGHIRHFAEAKRQGDVLVVSVTEDAHVNKGPHRPAFPEALRAEGLAALSDVDYVAISRDATAIGAIETLRPDVYVKGPDYRSAADDVTGGIEREEAAVRTVGGRIHFTEGETFSSSRLLNAFLPSFPPNVESYLGEFRRRYDAATVLDWLERLRALRTVIVGEAILDEYIYVDQMGKSSKDPVLAMRYDSRELYAGGALAIANHAASFCDSVELLTYVGSNDSQESFIRANLKPAVRANFVSKRGSPTIVKRRYVEKTLLSKLFEVYMINDDLLADDEEQQLCGLIDERIAGADCVVVADFGHGLLGKRAVSRLTASDRFLAVNTQVNAANIRFHAISKYPRADFICINEAELRLDARKREEPLEELVADLQARLACRRILVTRGSRGVLCADGEHLIESPSLTTRVLDRVGSGDAVLAIASLGMAAGLPSDVTAFLANVIGAQKVQIVGNSSAVDRVATVKFIQALLK